MRLFDTPGADSAYDRWLTTTPEDRAHLPECNCEKCHLWHCEEGMVADNALDAPQDFQCCVDQMEEWYESKRRCRKHPRSYAEEPCPENSFTAYCEGCEGEENKKTGGT